MARRSARRSLAAGVLCVLMVGFFVGVVLPRSLITDQRFSLVHRDWALSAAAYPLVLVPLVAVGVRFV